MSDWTSEKLSRFEYLKSLEDKETLSTEEVDQLIWFGIMERDPSINGDFIKPCIRVLGAESVSRKILVYYASSDFVEKVGALKLLYWVKEEVYDDHDDIIEEAVTNNRNEYTFRKKILLPELRHCKHPVICYFFAWALRSEDMPKHLFSQKIEGTDALFRAVKDKKQHLADFIKLYPEYTENAVKNR